MDVLGLVKIPLDAQMCSPAAQAAQSCLGGLLHYGAQVTGELQLTGTIHDVNLYLQYLTAHLSPSQAIDHTYLIVPQVRRIRIAYNA